MSKRVAHAMLHGGRQYTRELGAAAQNRRRCWVTVINPPRVPRTTAQIQPPLTWNWIDFFSTGFCTSHCENFSKIQNPHFRGKIPKIPNTKSGTGFLTLPDSCFLYIAGDFVTKWLDFDSETVRSKPAEWSKSVLAEAAMSLQLVSMKNCSGKKSTGNQSSVSC